MRIFALNTTLILCVALLLAYVPYGVRAQVMQSAQYRILSDSINIGGGLSSTTAYVLESTGGEVATGESTSTSYALKAGYQQMQESYISMSGAEAVSLSPSIPGVTGGTSNGSTTITVVTDNPAGYSLSISSSASPAMTKDADAIADYAPLGSDPDFTFTTDAGDAQFGYSPSGIDIVDRFRDEGGVCNTGSGDTVLACWDGLDTTPTQIASSGSPNQPAGATTTIYFRVGIGGAVLQPPGAYIATTTVTVLPL